MRAMRIRHAVAVILLALGLLAAGCGDGGGDSAGSSDEGSASGTGYELALVAGWRDVTEKTEGSAIRFDLLIGRPGGTFTTNVNVLRENAGNLELGDLRKAYRGQLRSFGARKITKATPATVDDEDAFTYEYDARAPDEQKLHGRQVIVIHDGHAYTITLSALRSTFAAASDDLDTMLGSWRWK